MITTDANDLLMPIHDRMPVILKPEDYDLWLDPLAKNPEELKALLKPFQATDMKGYRVSDKVNKANKEGADLVSPVDDESVSMG